MAPVIKKLMKEDNGEELIIKGIATHFIEMVSSSYAVIKNEDEIEYNNMYKDKKSVSFKRLNSFGTGKANAKETLDKTIIEKFYTQEELDSFRIENFKDLYCYKEGKINKSKEE